MYRKVLYFWSLGTSLYLGLFCFLSLFLLFYVICAPVPAEGALHSRPVEVLARLARHWMKERVIKILHGVCYTGVSFGSAVDGKRAKRTGASTDSRFGPEFCSLRPSDTGNIGRATCRARMLRCNLR